MRRSDHCRIGSLEKGKLEAYQTIKDHCRIGSLEIVVSFQRFSDFDHCRIGSLETKLIIVLHHFT